jgi:predicted nucleic-acid-binding Zn-ribbon protein
MPEASSNCPKCAGGMQQGFILDVSYADRLVSRWVAGKPEKGFLGIVKIRGKEQHFIETIRCAQCGYLESYAKEPS